MDPGNVVELFPVGRVDGEVGDGGELALGRDRAVLASNGGDLCAQLHHGGIQVLAAAVISLDALPDAGT